MCLLLTVFILISVHQIISILTVLRLRTRNVSHSVGHLERLEALLNKTNSGNAVVT